jgi:Thiamine monophosphate synthase
MHSIKLKKFYFINKLNLKNLNKLNKNVSVIYRKYTGNIDEREIINIKQICRKHNREFFISNNIKLALKLSLDGIYLPSFNKSLKHRVYGLKKNFK